MGYNQTPPREASRVSSLYHRTWFSSSPRGDAARAGTPVARGGTLWVCAGGRLRDPAAGQCAGGRVPGRAGLRCRACPAARRNSRALPVCAAFPEPAQEEPGERETASSSSHKSVRVRGLPASPAKPDPAGLAAMRRRGGARPRSTEPAPGGTRAAAGAAGASRH